MGFLDYCRILAGLSWVAVVLYMLPSVWQMMNGQGRHGDPARLVCLGFGILMVCFVCRWWLMPDSPHAFAALYVASAIWGAYTIVAAASYGRGGRV